MPFQCNNLIVVVGIQVNKSESKNQLGMELQLFALVVMPLVAVVAPTQPPPYAHTNPFRIYNGRQMCRT